jgi:hypothetical protein
MPTKYMTPIRAAVGMTLVVVLQGCCHRHAVIQGPVPVPVRSERITFAVSQTEIEKLVGHVSCLIRTGTADATACEGAAVAVCVDRSDSEVRAEYRAVLTAVSKYEFTNPFAFNHAIKQLIGEEATGTLLVADARREASCREWSEEGSCGALRYRDVWILLKRRDTLPGPVQEIEVFLAGQPCRAEVPNADAR